MTQRPGPDQGPGHPTTERNPIVTTQRQCDNCFTALNDYAITATRRHEIGIMLAEEADRYIEELEEYDE